MTVPARALCSLTRDMKQKLTPDAAPLDLTLILKEGASVWGSARVRVKER